MPACKRCEDNGDLGKVCPHQGDRQLIRMANDAVWEEGYAVGASDAILRAAQYRRILDDLIAELRVAPPQTPVAIDGMPFYGKVRGGPSPRKVSDALDRAEQRLKEVTGNE